MNSWLYDKLSDELLMRSYARGRSRAFEVLYARHKIPLFKYLRRQCGSDAVAEELAQDAWMAVIKGSTRYSPKAKFTTWLYRIAHNRLVDHWRKFGPTANVITEELSESLTDKSLISKERSSQGARVAELMQLVNTLPKEQLTTLLLKISGFSRNEIAEITDANPETVKSRLRYAKKHLNAELEVSA